MADTELVTAIAFGLTYFYLKCKQSEIKKRRARRQRRWWMKKIHHNRTRQFIEEKFNELLYEPSGEFDNFCRMSYSDFEFLLQKISPMISKHDTDFREAIPAKFRLAITLRFLASGLMIWSDMIRIDDEGAVDVDGAGAIGVGICFVMSGAE
ncbi:hypothetical protein HF086_003265 [Spodoptera exigua]|uniref:Nuclease HARBI1 n=1 Tax=Spodoptera exigua TaxID=7107 RepID=A0A922MGY8_SPOEX|nr:hypothetical protein HF086_003265 [Spodoptera exigua]